MHLSLKEVPLYGVPGMAGDMLWLAGNWTTIAPDCTPGNKKELRR